MINGKQTLWEDCLLEEVKEGIDKGNANIYFTSVDKRVLRKSKIITSWQEDEKKEQLALTGVKDDTKINK